MRRPFKQIISTNARGITRPEALRGNPNSIERPRSRRAFKELIAVNGNAASPWITTRCYSPTGRLLWDADHGADVLAMTVDSAGNIYTVGQQSHAFQTTGFVYQLLRKYSPSGRLLWSAPTHVSGVDYWGEGVAVNSSGEVYVSRWQNGTWLGSPGTWAEVAKYDADGSFMATLPYTAWYPSPQQPHFWRLAIDPDDELVALGGSAATEGVFKWISDLQEWEYTFSASASTWSGLSIDSAGNIAVGKLYGSGATYIFDSFGPDDGHPTVGGFDYRALLAPAVAGDSVSAVAALSTSVVLVKRFASGLGNVIQALTIPTPPTTTPTATTLISSPTDAATLTQKALATNSAGVFCYGTDRTISGATHRVYEYPNTPLWAADHGGDIADCFVMPDGKVIIAGKRVRR